MADNQNAITVSHEDREFIREISALPVDKQILIRGVIKGILIEMDLTAADKAAEMRV